MKKYQITDKKRDKKILEYKEKGYSITAIGGIFHITKQRVSQIIKRAKKLSTGEPLDKVS